MSLHTQRSPNSKIYLTGSLLLSFYVVDGSTGGNAGQTVHTDFYCALDLKCLTITAKR